jgi:hypothetical protein
MKTPTTFENILVLHKAGHRQQHPCTCGPSSLSLVTQALGLDPKPEAAWLSQDFSRWIPVEKLTTERGMALHEAHLTTEVVYPQNVEITLRRAYPENKHQFLADLRDAAARNDVAVVINFAQDHVLEQPFQGQGSPHFSPVAGFDEHSNRVLIADVDYEIAEPYWVSVDRVFESMAMTNPAFKTPRGWLVVRKRAVP